jgi:hypothetical protein
LLQKQLDDAATVTKVTEVLPDGKTISYDLTADNAQMVFWNQDGKVVISDKRVISYISSVNAATRKAVCGSTSDLFTPMDISTGTLDTTKKTVTDPDVFCLELLASSKNPDKTTKDAAVVVLDKVYDTTAKFTQSATIQ